MTIAHMDCTPQALSTVLALLPATVRVCGSWESPEGTENVRLRLDVTATGLPGGAWQGTIKSEGGTLTASFGPQEG